jgi:hypothetical protein
LDISGDVYFSSSNLSIAFIAGCIDLDSSTVDSFLNPC